MADPQPTIPVLRTPTSVQVGEAAWAGVGHGRRGWLHEALIIATVPCLYWLMAHAMEFELVIRIGRTTIVGAVMVMLIAAVLDGAWALRPRRGPEGWIVTARLSRALMGRIWQERWHWVRGAALVLLSVVFLDVYTAYKNAIPRFTAYTWDPVLSELDAELHVGTNPHDALYFLLGYPRIVRMLDLAYWHWAHISISFVCLGASVRDRFLRSQFMLAFFMTWSIGGTVLAGIFASGGPVYFDRFAPGAVNPYASFVASLSAIDGLTAVRLHETVWAGFTAGGDPRASGVSAMPSMHVAMAALCARFVIARGNLALGWISVAYVFVIALGSVVLAWHYAIDVYVSIALVLGCWAVAGKFTVILRRPFAS